MSAKIVTKSLSIDFPIYDRMAKSVRSQIEQSTGLLKKKEIRRIKALKNINLVLKNGDRIGVLGRNGAGKSTLLKALAGIYSPSEGSIEIDGKISSLFNVSIGLDKDASGIENIPLLMAARAIPLSEKEAVTSQVINFSELGEALTRPVRTYSAGMKLRLAFAVATAKSAEILLLDEVVGVGDGKFREKSKERIEQLMEGAGILVTASHSAKFLKTYCDRGVILEKGQVVFEGPIDEAILKHDN